MRFAGAAAGGGFFFAGVFAAALFVAGVFAGVFERATYQTREVRRLERPAVARLHALCSGPAYAERSPST